MFFNSAIFLKKIGPETHSDPKFGRREGGVNYIDARKKKGPGTSFGLHRSDKELPER
jgi:hypothetical protein